MHFGFLDLSKTNDEQKLEVTELIEIAFLY